MKTRWLFSTTIAALVAASATAPRAEMASTDYPAKAVRMIVPLAPGGGSDIVGRILAQALSEHWDKPVIVDNRPGAGSTVGTAIAARAAPDGYTVLVTSSSLAISPALYPELEFDVLRDFAPVTLIASQPSILAVHPSVQAATVEELIAIARSRKLAYGSAGIGSATHLGTELLLQSAGTRMQHVPYKSAGQATGALLAGEVQVLLTNMASIVPHVGGGKLKALGVSSRKRSPAVPDVPTLAESGLSGFEYATWYGMLAPAKTPPAMQLRLHAAATDALAIPATRQRLTSAGLAVHGSTSAEFERYLKQELTRWVNLVRSTELGAD